MKLRSVSEKLLFYMIAMLILFGVFLNNPVAARINSNQLNNESTFKNRDSIEILQFNVTAVSPQSVELQWKLSQRDTDTYIKIIRYFLVFKSVIAVISSTENNFTDHWAQFGTQYGYKIVVIDKDDRELAQSKLEYVITPVGSDNPNAPSYNWTTYRDRKYPFYSRNYLNYNESDFTVFRYMLHGVNVTVVIAKNLSPYPSESFLESFVNNVFIYFHRHWTVYRAFPVKEYRVVVIHNGHLEGENELGLQYGDTGNDAITSVGTGERLSHEIGHAWMGGLIFVERNLPNGHSFDPQTQDSDKWILEGFEHFYGIIQLNLSGALSMLTYDLQYYRNTMVNTSLDKPLVDLPVYFGTKYAYTYYCKGGLVAYLINKILIDVDNKTLNDFMRYLYNKYNITSFDERETKSISTEELLNELNNFSEHNFTEFFNKYVYDTVELPLEKIDKRYIEALQNFTEEIPIQIDVRKQPQNALIMNEYSIIILTAVIIAAVTVTIVVFMRRKKMK